MINFPEISGLLWKECEVYMAASSRPLILFLVVLLNLTRWVVVDYPTYILQGLA